MAINTITGNTVLETGFFPPARVASTGSPLTPAVGGLLTVDGIVLKAGDRVLCKDETSAINNGIYAAATGPWVRTSDANNNTNFFSGMAILVALGTTNAGKIFICTCADDPVVVGTSLLTFVAQSVIITANITINSGLINQLAYYAAAGQALSGLTTANNGVLITSGAGAPSISSTLPAAVQGNITATGTVASGTWQGTIVGATFGGTGVNNGSSTITLAGNLTIATNGGTIAFGGASKTLTIDNSLEFAGTDNTKFTFPTTTDTVVTLASTATLTNKTFDTAGAGNVLKINGTQVSSVAGSGSQAALANYVGFVRVALTGVNFNSANTDNAITIPLPAGISRYQVQSARIGNASHDISTATAGLFTAAGGGGQTIAASQAITVTATGADAANNSQNLTITNAGTEAYNDATLQFRIGTAEGAAATADVVLIIVPMT